MTRHLTRHGTLRHVVIVVNVVNIVLVVHGCRDSRRSSCPTRSPAVAHTPGIRPGYAAAIA